MTAPLRIGICGFGKIARDEHAGAIANSGRAELVALADPAQPLYSVPCYPDVRAMLEAHPDIAAVAMCQPPQVRFEAAEIALDAGKHVFLEKPPGITPADVEKLECLARQKGVTLFTGWHSQWPRPVKAMRDWCSSRKLRRISIRWLEDVRLWHPGQQWIWDEGGFGVFDPGMNALSIITSIVQERIQLTGATLEVPANRRSPIAADLTMRSEGGIDIDATFDWRQEGPQVWEIIIEADKGTYRFSQGGLDGAHAQPSEESALADDYRQMYARFFELIDNGEGEVDLAPLRLVEEAFMCGTSRVVDDFHD